MLVLQLNHWVGRWGNHKNALKSGNHLPFHKLTKTLMIGILNYMRNAPVKIPIIILMYNYNGPASFLPKWNFSTGYAFGTSTGYALNLIQ